jgi:predicted PurR-regulated permease PerM
MSYIKGEGVMKRIFSLRWLIGIAIVLFSLLSIYMFFLIVPFLLPIWLILYTVAIPFIISMIIAYLLHPLVDLLMKFRLKRVWAVLVLYLFFFSAFLLLAWVGIPLITNQVKGFIENVPEFERQIQNFLENMENHVERLPDGIHNEIDAVASDLEKSVRRGMKSILDSIGKLVGNIFALIVVPFLVFYLLLDVEVIQKTLYLFLPNNKRKPAAKLWKDIDESLGEYIRGQIFISAVVGILAYIGYYVIGLPYAIFFAFFVSITNIIPYFGPYIGAAPALLMALFTQPSLILMIIGINTGIQMIEGNLLAPYILGKRLHIHPIFIIFALLIGAELGGVVGMILAVPLFVVLKVIILNVVLHFREYKIDRSENY